MKTPEIERLLEKYYKGESSREEELILRRFFDNEKVSNDFEVEKAMFRFYSENGEVPEPSEDLGKRIISSIDSQEKESLFTLARPGRLVYSGIAATLLVLIGLYFFLINNNEPGDTYSNPEIAYAETLKILYGVSHELNKGTEQFELVRKFDVAAEMSFSAINRSTGIVEKNLKNLDYFQKAINIIASPMEINVNK